VAFSQAEHRAMARAIELARTPDVPSGPNPRVGCVVLGPDGTVVAEGYHRGAGTPHAEADALANAGGRARGTTVVVTLEPCTHTGRTAPCSSALVDAGVARVVYAQTDPNPVAAGGAAVLHAAGVDVEHGLLAAEAVAVNREWNFAIRHGRPFVTWKLAATLDGRSAAADGTSRWVSSPAARLDTHRLRASADVILAGTGTVLIDDPELSVRDAQGVPSGQQPLRAVMGLREVPADRRVLNDVAETVVLTTRDPAEALAQLNQREMRHVFLEGGPTLAAAFLRAGLVDEVVAYVAPMLLGAGLHAVADLGITTIADALRFEVVDIAVVGEGNDANARFTLTPVHHEEP
jgi:diaminohydroxyphosphoribosylaminopyrimidine deaminase/5-amino-6-(5-phosphoribosylamino)uracil reductase